MGKALNLTARIVLGLATAGAGITSLTGCTKPEYEVRINAAFQNPKMERHRKEILAIYKSINPKNLTKEQKAYLETFENNEEKYKDKAFPWMGNLTVQDKIYIMMDEDSANAMLNAVSR